MNFKAIRRILGSVLKIEAVCMVIPCVCALIYREKEGVAYLAVGLLCLIWGWVLASGKTADIAFFAKEGFLTVGLSWIVMSAAGALPFFICGDIPDYVDALFETVSGFTTTGASILNNVEALSHTSLIWRSFTHWVGGMGVFVLLLAILPSAGGYNMHLMRAESPGPSVGKLVPRLKESAYILYVIYFVLTLFQIAALLFADMPAFDAVCAAFGTAGTGGFGIRNDSFASYSTAVQVITGIFMVLFGVNFNAYFFLLGKEKKNAFKIEEVKIYFIIIFLAIVAIASNILDTCTGIFDALHKAGFQVASVITTTGFATENFDLWPSYSKTVLVILMFIGACAGSTGGGIKVSRIVIMFKSVISEIKHFIHPRGVYSITMDGKIVDPATIRGVQNYLIAYVMIFAVSVLAITFDGHDLVTNFTAVAATFNNIGPGLGMVGPAGNYGDYGYISKAVLMFDMLAGRLELYPMLMLFVPMLWKGRKK